MKHTKVVIVPETTRVVTHFVTCDICKEKLVDAVYKINEVKIVHKVGTSYPEGGSGSETSVDMCGKCFNEKLIPWLKSQGAEPKTEEWSW